MILVLDWVLLMVIRFYFLFLWAGTFGVSGARKRGMVACYVQYDTYSTEQRAKQAYPNQLPTLSANKGGSDIEGPQWLERDIILLQ